MIKNSMIIFGGLALLCCSFPALAMDKLADEEARTPLAVRPSPTVVLSPGEGLMNDLIRYKVLPFLEENPLITKFLLAQYNLIAPVYNHKQFTFDEFIRSMEEIPIATHIKIN